MPDDVSLRHRLRVVADDRLGPTEQSLIVAWAGFGATFGITRAITHWIRAGHGPSSGGMSAGGRHLHHYNIGILLLAAVGGVAIRGEEKHRRHPVTASAYGSGAALIVDELALLIDLEDVYWARDGRKSVDAAIGLLALGGVYLAAAPFWHDAACQVLRRSAR
jgi:hypothetical protein